ncbi:MAG: peptidase M24 [Rhodospirillaceae bacterium]|nr:peptidase M24 [Rhodospirillaceae bacterium]
MLAVYVIAVFLVVAGGGWLVFDLDLLPIGVHAPNPVVGARATRRPVTRVAQSVAKGPEDNLIAIPAYDIGERTFQPSPLPLSLPVACDPGVDCWIFNYVDVDPGTARADFACGQMSYDTHKGTDIALAHEGRLADEVAVLAAATGLVIGVRDGMVDANIRLAGRASVKDRECGNGVRLDHGGGWYTQYCHLKHNSVNVKTGDRVRNGDRIGSVGLSGLTEFPHLHLGVEKDGKVVDPFVGISGGERCQIGKAPLWRPEVLERLRYLSAVPYNIGFTDRIPDIMDIRSGKADNTVLSSKSSALVFWVEVAGLRPKDYLSVRLFGPDGVLLARKEETIERYQIRVWRAIGKKSKTGWPPGTYRGEVAIIRETATGPMEARRSARVDVF